ncbi:hypothetical protein EV421DRAFT_2021178 [Armillaria borealis]|uniref:Uncharacterized protein n=1 Tax=Armillaria borealis TaxID=47425 RepID=A0AA39J9D1_9AGAR|nr:hypothetical protein EV421DRAFT_2021178 [Armillaria borealis]
MTPEQPVSYNGAYLASFFARKVLYRGFGSTDFHHSFYRPYIPWTHFLFTLVRTGKRTHHCRNHGTFKLAIPSFVPERNSRLSQVRTAIPQFEHSKKKLPAVLPGIQAKASYFVQCIPHPGWRRARIGFGTVLRVVIAFSPTFAMNGIVEAKIIQMTLFSVLRKSATGGMGTVATCIPSTWAGPCLWCFIYIFDGYNFRAELLTSWAIRTIATGLELSIIVWFVPSLEFRGPVADFYCCEPSSLKEVARFLYS